MINRPPARRALVMVALALLAIPGCGGPDRDGGRTNGPWNVLLLTLDTTRSDHVGCYGNEEASTPVLDRLADEGVRFETAVAQAPITLPSHASILTGAYPYRHGARANGFYSLPTDRTTMAEYLSDEGYQTAAVTAAFVLDSRFGLDQGFGVYDDDLDSMQKATEFQDASRTAMQVTDRALEIASDLDGKRPFFLWAHYFDPHFPYTPPPDMASRFPDTREGRYHGEIATMDREIGRLIDGLRKQGLLERTILVAIGDHGEGFPGPHDEDSHGFYVYSDTLRVPFLIHAPGRIRQGLEVEALARQVDVLPTVLDLLSIELPPGLDGQSLAATIEEGDEGAADEAPAEPPAVDSYAEAVAPWYAYGWAALFQLRDQKWKYIDAPTPELYDLESDPEESRNLAADEPDRARAMQAELDRRLGSTDSSPGARSASQKERDRLRALGYVSGAVSANDPLSGEANRKLRNPREWIDVHKGLKNIDTMYLNGEVAGAITELERLRGRDPDNYQVIEHLGLYHDALGQLAESEAAYRRLTEIKPDLAIGWDRLGDVLEKRAQKALAEQDSLRARTFEADAINCWTKAFEKGSLESDPMVKLAVHHLKNGRPAEAEPLLEAGLRILEDSFDLHRLLGMSLMMQRRPDESRQHLERAIVLAGDNIEMATAVRLNLVDLYRALGLRDKTIETVEWILEKNPGHPATQVLQQVLAEAKGN